MAQDFATAMRSKLQAKPKPKGPVLENYTPSWSDWLASKAADMFGSSNAGKQAITDYMREKINPLIPIVGQKEAIRQAQGKIAQGDIQSGVMDLALEAGGPTKAIFIGPMAKSWNKAAAREATEMLKAKRPLNEIWEKTRTGFHKIKESPRGPSYPGVLAPMQEVSSRHMIIDPDLRKNIPSRSNPKAIQEFMEHPIFQEYPGTGMLNLFGDPDPMAAGALWSRPGPKRGLSTMTGVSVNPTTLRIAEKEMPVSTIRTDLPQDQMTMQQVLEHEFQHAAQHIEGWPVASWGMLDPNRNLMEAGTPEKSLANELLGTYGKQRYPGGRPKERLKYGFYSHGVDEAMARNAEARTFLNEAARDAQTPRFDIPYNMQIIPDLVRERHDAKIMESLLGLKP